MWDVLVNEAGAFEGDRGSFVHHQTTAGSRSTGEWRFCGALGFGGKFRRNVNRLPDGTWGEQWYVDCYRENETPETLAIIATVNPLLNALREKHLRANTESSTP